MQEIIDMHAHIIPGLDDGAFNMDEAQEMLQMAYDQGIRIIIATPHFKKGQNPQRIQTLYKKLQKKANEIHKEFKIYLGQEILYSEDTIEELKNKRAFTMCESTYVLIEFAPMVSYTRLYQSLRKLTLAHYTPILAHMERYLCLRKKGRVQELIASGYMLQMNYLSIVGSRFQKDIHWCREQIKKEQVHMLATDMHHVNQRKPEIENALIWLKTHCSMDYYQKLVRDNSKNMLKEREEKMGVINEDK